MPKRLAPTDAQAAAAIGIELATFRHLVSCGRLPGPIPELGGRYDMKAIHAALDRMSGLGGASSALERWRERRAG